MNALRAALKADGHNVPRHANLATLRGLATRYGVSVGSSTRSRSKSSGSKRRKRAKSSGSGSRRGVSMFGGRYL